MFDVTDVILGNSVSMTISLFAAREPLAPGAGKVKTATLTAASLMRPPFNSSAELLT